MIGLLAGGAFAAYQIDGDLGDAIGQYSYAGRTASGFAPLTSDEMNSWFEPTSNPFTNSASGRHMTTAFSLGYQYGVPASLQLQTARNLFHGAKSLGILAGTADMYRSGRLASRVGAITPGMWLEGPIEALSRSANYIMNGKDEVPSWAKTIFGAGGGNRTNPLGAGFAANTALTDRFVTSLKSIESHFGKYGITGNVAKEFREQMLTGAFQARAYTGVPGSPVSTKMMKSGYTAMQKLHQTSLWKLLRQTGGSPSKIIEHIQDPNANRVVFRYTNNVKNARTAAAMEAGVYHAFDKVTNGTTNKLIEKGLYADVQKFVLSSMNRSRILSAGLTAVRIGAALSVVPAIAGSALTSLTNLSGRTMATIGQLRRTDFGGGDVLDTARLATERQRQMMAIQNSGMNARGLMGNEAQYYR